MVVGIIYSRAADAVRIVQGTHAVCVCTMPYLDWMGEVLVLVYSTLVILLKELRVSMVIAKSVLVALSVLFMIHALITLRVWWAGYMTTMRPISSQLRQRDVELAATPALAFRIRSMR